jgi:hypothetical protein
MTPAHATQRRSRQHPTMPAPPTMPLTRRTWKTGRGTRVGHQRPCLPRGWLPPPSRLRISHRLVREAEDVREDIDLGRDCQHYCSWRSPTRPDLMYERQVSIRPNAAAWRVPIRSDSSCHVGRDRSARDRLTPPRARPRRGATSVSGAAEWSASEGEGRIASLNEGPPRPRGPSGWSD